MKVAFDKITRDRAHVAIVELQLKNKKYDTTKIVEYLNAEARKVDEYKDALFESWVEAAAVVVVVAVVGVVAAVVVVEVEVVVAVVAVVVVVAASAAAVVVGEVVLIAVLVVVALWCALQWAMPIHSVVADPGKEHGDVSLADDSICRIRQELRGEDKQGVGRF